MNHFSMELSVACLVPALILCGYVLYKDRIEREPVGLLVLLTGAGAIAYVASFVLQKLAILGIDSLFAEQMQFLEDGTVIYADEGAELMHHILCAFVGTALIQVCLKWLLLYLLTHRHRAFNYLYDGVVYSTMLSLGFAVTECIVFAFQNDTELVLPKLLTSIPAHLFVGVLMGWLYTMWRARFLANGIENMMLKARVVDQDRIQSSAVWLILTLIVPSIVCGGYVLAGSMQSEALTSGFIVAVYLLYGLSFIVIDQVSCNDKSCKRFLCRMIAKDHPNLTVDQIQQIVDEGVKIGDQDA